MRGTQSINIELLNSPRYQITVDTIKWGPLLWCFYSGSYPLLLHLVTTYSFNLRKELLLDPDEDPGEDSAGQFNELMPFLIVIDGKSLEGLHILMMQEFNHLWIMQKHLKEVFQIMKSE